MQEIITNPPRDEYLDSRRWNLDNAQEVATIKDLTLRKATSNTEIHYGLFDKKDNLVGYLSLDYAGKNIWEVTLVQLAQAYKGLGYGTFLYDYAVMNDKLRIMSDGTNTDGVHGSKNLWLRLKRNNRYSVVGYNKKDQNIMPDATEDDIYNDSVDIRWMAIPSDKTINESITHIQATMRNRYVVWYGPGTTSDEYFNF